MATVSLTPFVGKTKARDADQALKLAIATMAKSQHCAVLWFADIQARKLYRKLGYSSMYQYAEMELGFSSTRTGNFLRLANKLQELPALKKELESGDIGYTKGLEVAKVANSKNEKQWLEEARFEALWEKLHKLGGVPTGKNKVDVILEGMARLLEIAGAKPGKITTPAVQINVHKCPDCEKATISTLRGEVLLAPMPGKGVSQYNVFVSASYGGSEERRV